VLAVACLERWLVRETAGAATIHAAKSPTTGAQRGKKHGRPSFVGFISFALHSRAVTKMQNYGLQTMLTVRSTTEKQDYYEI
jgi:hypothetical protein